MHGIEDENGFRGHPVRDRTVGTGADLEFCGRTAGIDSPIACTVLQVCVNRRRPAAGWYAGGSALWPECNQRTACLSWVLQVRGTLGTPVCWLGCSGSSDLPWALRPPV